MILGFDWFKSVNPQVDWVNYCVNLKNGFAAAGVPVHRPVKVELCSFKVPITCCVPVKVQIVGLPLFGKFKTSSS